MHGTMLTNLIMRGVIKGRGVGGRAFHLGALTLAPWRCPLLQPETLTSAYTHTHTQTCTYSAVLYREEPISHSAADKLARAISCGRFF